MGGPSLHLTWNELACWNRLGRPFGRFQPGELVAPYPQIWRETRGVQVAELFETLRTLLGDKPLRVNSGYRTEAYNHAVAGAGLSQHIAGRAIDIVHPVIPPRALFATLYELQVAGKLPLLGGLGSYRTFVHVDVRPKANGRLARWAY